MEFDFPPKKFVGISRLISHVSKECQELILWMITYNPDDRPSSSQILKHSYFKDLKELDNKKKSGVIYRGVSGDNNSTNSHVNSENASDGGESVISRGFGTNTIKKIGKGGKKNPHGINFPPIKGGKGSKGGKGGKGSKGGKGGKTNHHAEIKSGLKHNSSNQSITGQKINIGVKKFYSPYSQRPKHK